MPESTEDLAESAPPTTEAEDAEDAELSGSGDFDDDYAAPFEPKSFGGQFVWARAEGFEAKILRVRAGQKVVISTAGRKDMVVMLTGGRGVLEVLRGDEVDREELEPLAPVPIEVGPDYRLVAMTEVELFTLHAPADD